MCQTEDLLQTEDLFQTACCFRRKTVVSDYDSSQCLQYNRLPSYDHFVLTGPNPQLQASMEEDSDEEQVADDSALEDHYALLVKAWEQRVFPVIRRRFRNEAERKDGLEQIRGALQLGEERRRRLMMVVIMMMMMMTEQIVEEECLGVCACTHVCVCVCVSEFRSVCVML